MKQIFFILLSQFFLALQIFSNDLSSKITLITTISPCPTYPRDIFLQISQYSLVRNIPDFASMPKIIVCDGVFDLSTAEEYPIFINRLNPNENNPITYQQFKEKLEKLVTYHPYFQNTKLIFCDKWKCLAGALKEAFQYVETEYVFIHQDDFELTQPLDLKRLISAMDANPHIKHVRLNSGINSPQKSNTCDRHIDDYIEGGSTFPLIRTFGWSDNDHIARKDYYENTIFPMIGEDPNFMEYIMHKQETIDLQKDACMHSKYGTYLYGGFNEGPFIYHLDRRSLSW